MNGASILFSVRTGHILFITNVIWSDVEPRGSWRLDFWHVSFGMRARQSAVEPPGSCRLDFVPLGS